MGDWILGIIGLFGWASIVVLPGSWLTFGLSLERYSFLTRLLLGISLSPAVVFFQFYLLRGIGLEFHYTVFSIVLLNLPVVILIARKTSAIAIPSARLSIAAIALFVVALMMLLPQVVDSNIRIFTGHAWMQSDIVYMLARGELLLEEPELAGLRLVYPWAAHPMQAALSWLLNSAPAASYIWTNLVWLACSFGLAGLIVKEIGGDRLSRLTAFIWLCLGVNVVGYVIFVMIPAALGHNFWAHGPYNYGWIGGDYRITPWFLKFFFFEQSIFGHALVSATALVLVKEHRIVFTGDKLILLATLLTSIGLIYPVYFAPAIVAFVLTIMVHLHRRKTRNVITSNFGYTLSLIATVLVPAVVTYVYIKLLTIDRIVPSMILPSLSRRFLRISSTKAVASVVSLAIFIAGIAYVLRRPFLTKYRFQSIILLGTGLVCVAMYVLLEIPKPSAEYKFLLLAAIFLSPFAALSVQQFSKRDNTQRVPVLLVVIAALALPSAHKIVTDFPWTPPWPHPSAEPDGFDLKLGPDEAMRSLCDSVRLHSPVNAFLVAERANVHLPTLTQRSLFAPPLQDYPHAGIFIRSELLLETQKGYGEYVVAERRGVVQTLYHATDENDRFDAIRKLKMLNRPVIVIVERPSQAAFREWVSGHGNRPLYDDGQYSAWFLPTVE